MVRRHRLAVAGYRPAHLRRQDHRNALAVRRRLDCGRSKGDQRKDGRACRRNCQEPTKAIANAALVPHSLLLSVQLVPGEHNQMRSTTPKSNMYYISRTFITAYCLAPSAIPPLPIAVKESFRRLRLSPPTSGTSTRKSFKTVSSRIWEQFRQKVSDEIGEKGA